MSHSHSSTRRIRKPHATGKLHGSVFYGSGVIADRSFTLRGNRDLRPFCSRDLALDRMTFIYERDPYFLECVLDERK